MIKIGKNKFKYLWLFWGVPFFCSLFFGVCQSLFAFELENLEPIVKDDTILIFAPHPDDEALACSGIIHDALRKKAQVKIVYLTNGDHNQLAFIVYEKRLVFRKGEFIHMGEVRQKEAIKAMASLGLDQNNLIFLGYPDFGTFIMFTRYWDSPKPFKSLLTRLNKVPYKENFSFGKSFTPENILSDIETIIQTYTPTKIFVSHAADTNGDHRALALFLDTALWDLEGKIAAPRVFHYLIHHADWPLPRKYHPELLLEVPQDLHYIGTWSSFALRPYVVTNKYNALHSYKSQTESSGFYLFSFARGNELFQELPVFPLSREAKTLVDTYYEYAMSDNQLIIKLIHPVENQDISKLSMYVFGFRKDIAFSQMPKIFLNIRSNAMNGFDGKKHLDTTGIVVSSEGSATVIRLPLSLLNNPQKLLISVRIASKRVPYAQGIWSKFELKQ